MSAEVTPSAVPEPASEPAAPEPKPKKPVRPISLVRKFGSTASTHGIKAAIASKGGQRVFWVCVFLVALSCCFVQLVLLVIKYLQYPALFDLSNEPQPLPSVTVCNMNPYRRSAIMDNKNMEDLMAAYGNAMDKLKNDELQP